MPPTPTLNPKPNEDSTPDARSLTPAPKAVLKPDARSLKPGNPDFPVPPCDPCGESLQPDATTTTPASSRRSRLSGGGGISPSTQPTSTPPDDTAVDPWLPDSKFPPLPKDSVNSIIRNILLTNPYFPRFYADIILHDRPNSNEARILRPHYQKICEKVELMSNNNGTCTHIKVTGVRCGSPALHGEQFCYFHQNAHRTVRRPKQSRLHPIALIEDEESIQYSLMEVINALMRNTIDLKRATLILRALHIAVKNATRVKYNIHANSMVTDIPKYAEPTTGTTGTEEDVDETSPIELPAVAANPNLPVSPEGPHYWEMQAEAARRTARDESLRFAAEAKSREEARHRFAEERAQEAKAREEWKQQATAAATTTAHVGTAAIGCPAKPQASASVGADAFVRPAPLSEAKRSVPTADATTKPATPNAVLPHNFKKTSEHAQPTKPPQRKPPTSANPAPKERKNTAHRASGG